jgi:eukaryotic-like serine/threonine-protein kinase
MKQFGPFDLESRLGRGGSAEVWRATRRGPHGFARAVAVKRLLPERRNPHLVRALLDEARLAARLSHRNVAQVLEVIDVGGEAAIVMELVDGCELRALVQSLGRRGPPPPGFGAFVTHEVARALAAAHAERPPILHRDVSPTNVLVSRGGEVKLADFGIGKALADDGDDVTGSFKGNLGYMAPEQLARAPLSPASDVYAAGALAWELLTGARLFPAFDAAARARTVEPPSRRNAAVPPELDAVVLRALSPSPRDRFADGGELADALAPLVHRLGFGETQLAAAMLDVAPPDDDGARHTQTNAPAPAPPSSSPPPPRRPLALLLIGGAALAGVVAFFAWPRPIASLPPPPPSHQTPTPLPIAATLPPPPTPSSPPTPTTSPPSTPPKKSARKHPGAKPTLVDGKLVDPFAR